ncbi:uncharacterized protein C8A04DRAFT_11709 [Dichotomopilus funicola]|uniref:Complex I intermediate-associated protein 84 n=1 Tax=Dichotomopilus funicola TaxID=1934379 RepID=A0AAN6ZN87_9PEZI|nr:hypothetical protein C8A04DRAFT_11709 [Dichotomopilus funicola]
MRSQHLTRNVCSLRLLARHGLLRPCPSLPGRCYAVSSRAAFLPYAPPASTSLPRGQPRRTFFGIFQKPPRMLKEPDLEPGYDVLLQFRSVEVENARPPPREDLLRGWRQFIQYKRKNYHQPLNPTQAFLIQRLLRHLLAVDADDATNGATNGATNRQQTADLGFADLRTALWVTVTKPPKGTTEHHLELAKLVYAEIERRIQEMRGLGVEEDVIRDTLGGKEMLDLELYLTALSQYGAAREAAVRLADRKSKGSGNKGMAARERSFWTIVLRGLAKEGREEELLAEFANAEAAKLEYQPPIHEIMTTFYAQRDQVEETKRWFSRPIQAGWAPSPKVYLELVRFAVRNREQAWLQPIFERLINSDPQKDYWDVVFQWAVLAMDKGVEDVKQMIQVMSAQRSSTGSRQQQQEQPPPQQDNKDRGPKADAATINALISAAIEKQNPYLAERFLSLGAELQIPPSASTYILQMDYRLDAQDFSGVRALYDKLLKGEVPVYQDEDLPVLNKYLRALCAVHPEPDLGRILDITADLEQRHATLEPDTVVALCMVFLRSDNQFEVIDTLSLHTVSYSRDERAQVRRAFVDYCCLDRHALSTARAWDAYSLLRQFFPDTDPSERARLMDAFFARRRPDMACYIFGHMRSSDSPGHRPTADMYVRCLEGLGRHPDGTGTSGSAHADSLKMIHNMLKMDTTVQLDTRLRNALMMAYAACDEPHVAIHEFWRDITASAEGPSYASLAIVFWACELSPFGDRVAREIWQKVQRMDLAVPAEVFGAYCGAIAGNGHVEEVMRLIRGMEGSVGCAPGMMTLGVPYNALPWANVKDQFETWARAEYPDIWAQLEKKGRKQTIQGTKFNIRRDMRA